MATYKYYPIDLPILFIEAQIFVAIKRNSHFCQISLSLLAMVQLLSGSDLLEIYTLVIFKDTGVTSVHLAILYQVSDIDTGVYFLINYRSLSRILKLISLLPDCLFSS